MRKRAKTHDVNDYKSGENDSTSPIPFDAVRRLYRYLLSGGLFAVSLLFTNCAGMQSALDPAGTQSNSIGKLFLFFLYVCTAVFALVMLVLLVSIFRRRKQEPQFIDIADAHTEDKDAFAPDTVPDPNRERRMTQTVVGALAATIVILFVLLIYSYTTGRAVASNPASADAITIHVTGHQWWWEVRYEDSATPSNTFTTANEIHIPVGHPVKLRLTSQDVIHSFWVPNLHGKKDLIPGQENDTWLQADKPGTYRGQCAEFCGHQHAHMAFLVVAESMDQFNVWLAAQRSSSVQPGNESQARGQQVFLSSPCMICHTISGTAANGKIAPELTHIASRQTIAAGTLPNTRGHLAGWIIDSQSIKPGNRMPPNSLSSEDLQSLLDYLQTLK